MAKTLNFEQYFDNNSIPATPDEILENKFSKNSDKIVAILSKVMGKDEGLFYKEDKVNRDGEPYVKYTVSNLSAKALLKDVMELFAEE